MSRRSPDARLPLRVAEWPRSEGLKGAPLSLSFGGICVFLLCFFCWSQASLKCFVCFCWVVFPLCFFFFFGGGGWIHHDRVYKAILTWLREGGVAFFKPQIMPRNHAKCLNVLICFGVEKPQQVVCSPKEDVLCLDLSL